MSEYIKKENVDTLIDELARAISDERCFMSRGRSTASIMQDILDLPTYFFPDSAENSGTFKEGQILTSLDGLKEWSIKEAGQKIKF